MNIFFFFTSLLIAFAITPLVIMIYQRMGWLDDPTKSAHPKVIHTRPIPRGGGVAVFCSLLLSTFLFVPYTPTVLGIFFGATILMLVGFWDDLKDPPPLIRFALQVIAALTVVSFGIGISFVTNPFGGLVLFSDIPYASSLLAVIWIVWCMNIVNFSKGVDGQMPGYVVVAGIVITLLSLRFSGDPSQLLVTRLSIALAGTFAGFLFWNAYPQKILPGFGASTLAGFFLAILSILSGAKLATAILVLAIPMIDAGVVIARRLRQKKSPLLGDRSHLHHTLLDIGWTKRNIAFFYWGSAAFFGLIALQLKSEQKVFTIAATIIVVVGALLWLRYFSTSLVKSGHGNG